MHYHSNHCNKFLNSENIVFAFNYFLNNKDIFFSPASNNTLHKVTANNNTGNKFNTIKTLLYTNKTFYVSLALDLVRF